jgi:type IV fimbrial biogenesis protein FimT
MARGKYTRHDHARGLTLVELMVTLAIVAVGAAIAAPSFRGMIADTRLSAQANDLLASLKYTRSEAVKRNARVTICKKASDATCAVTDTATASWQGGWLVFVDGGVAGTLDGADTILRVQGPLAASTLVGDGAVTNYVSYIGSGQTSAAAGGTQVGTFSLCDPLAGAKRKKIAVTQGSGWVGVTTVAAAASCSAS